uniref:Pentatricopeptide repeat-containing protein At3g18840 family n=1 Tax=Cajanus cajan TaxID=3821 RepID=A0A151TG66_CAJCA|nr:Putative pentatricopeptide repeat-containing protein At3g18840 family [Cajanus cajan]
MATRSLRVRDALVYRDHVQAIKSGLVSSIFTCNQLIHLYSNHGLLQEAHKLFDEMPHPNVFSWNAIIMAYIKAHNLTQARALFDIASHRDLVSYNSMLSAYVGADGGCDGMVDLVSKNAMVAACCREGNMNMALNVFWKNPELNDTVSWNTLIAGYAQNGYMEKSLTLFVEMIENGIGFNEHTLAKIGVESSFAVASLIAGYSSQGNMTEAQRLFDSLLERNSVVWTALCSGYVKSQQCETVFKLFREFITKEAPVPDGMIIISVLGACAIQAALSLGKQIHAYILRMRFIVDKKLLSALVDMYSKCGNVIYAEKIFRLVTDSDRDAILYNVMIAGYAHHGFENKAIRLFQEMLNKSVKPDAVTFVALLSACRHRGLVELGEQFFISMKQDYNVLPEIYHYACMVDMYGRAKQLEKAVEFMRKIPIQIDATIWGAFLNACQMSSDAALVKQAEEELLKVEADNGSRYVQLANAYASKGKWDEMGRIRKKMRGYEAKKFAGCSWIYVENGIHVFTSGDTSHSKADAIYSTLICLNGKLYLSQN